MFNNCRNRMYCVNPGYSLNNYYLIHYTSLGTKLCFYTSSWRLRYVNDFWSNSIWSLFIVSYNYVIIYYLDIICQNTWVLEALYYLPWNLNYNQTWLLVVLYLLTYYLLLQKYLYLEFPVYKTKQSTITTFDFGLCHSNLVGREEMNWANQWYVYIYFVALVL